MRVNMAQAPSPSLSPVSSSPSHHASNLSPSSISLQRSESFVGVGSLPNLSSPWKSKTYSLRRCCSAACFDGHDLTQKREKAEKFNGPMVKTRMLSSRPLGAQVDVLEPSFLGIKPEPPEWPAREEVIRECIARRASSIELPLSLRMIKLKQRIQKMQELRENGKAEGESFDRNSPICHMCYSTLHIIREVQTQALKTRGLVLEEDLDGISRNVEKEMTSSFGWLFREVFAKTPDLMLQVMLLTSNFATHSLETYTAPRETLEETSRRLENKEGLDRDSRSWGIGQLELGKSGVPTKEVLDGMDEKEVGLWNSMVEEANKMNGRDVEDKGLGLREQNLGFVSPVRVEIERDEYEEYFRTNLGYQSGLSEDPNNPLLLYNYAQFLWLVSRDYDRAEECFKRAIQLDPSDAEVVSQYANFLWLVRKDFWGAEERYQEALATEPEASLHASRYANFLWSTGAEDTCFPLDHPQTQEL